MTCDIKFIDTDRLIDRSINVSQSIKTPAKWISRLMETSTSTLKGSPAHCWFFVYSWRTPPKDHYSSPPSVLLTEDKTIAIFHSPWLSAWNNSIHKLSHTARTTWRTEWAVKLYSINPNIQVVSLSVHMLPHLGRPWTWELPHVRLTQVKIGLRMNAWKPAFYTILSVICHCGGQKVCFIPWWYEISPRRRYHCVLYGRRHQMDLVSAS